MARLIVLDRDGVINRDSEAFIKSVDEFEPIEGSVEAMAELSRAGFKIAVCTNQSGVGRGLLSEATLADIHARLQDLVHAAGGRIDGLTYCPHLPNAGCDCRKPRPGMLRRLMNELRVGPEATSFVGDSLRDIEAARAAGCRPVLVLTGNGIRDLDAARALGVTEVHDDLHAFVLAEIAGLAKNREAQH